MARLPKTAETATGPSIRTETSSADFRILLSGNFTLHQKTEESARWKTDLPSTPGTTVTVDGTGIASWDSSLILLLQRIRSTVEENRGSLQWRGFPESIHPLLNRAAGMPGDRTTGESSANTAGKPGEPERTEGIITRFGGWGLGVAQSFAAFLIFFGETLQSLGRLLRGKAIFQRSDLVALLWENTGRSFGIVFLISFLTGLILAFVGAIQLEQFGADIFVADLVAIAMFREMGAMMTGVILAGRTGSAYAAQIGSMKANDELNALQTMGISPFDFIVLPRLATLAIMMPVLAFLASLSGIFGGMVVSVGFMDITATQFLTQTANSIDSASFFSGIGKSVVFGAIIAITGCFKGMAASSSAESVGNAATSAVVTSIVCIIVADALFAVLFNIYGI